MSKTKIKGLTISNTSAEAFTLNPAVVYNDIAVAVYRINIPKNSPKARKVNINQDSDLIVELMNLSNSNVLPRLKKSYPGCTIESEFEVPAQKGQGVYFRQMEDGSLEFRACYRIYTLEEK